MQPIIFFGFVLIEFAVKILRQLYVISEILCNFLSTSNLIQSAASAYFAMATPSVHDLPERLIEVNGMSISLNSGFSK